MPLASWEPTKDTLHLWSQIVGKVQLALTPRRNHWWNVTLQPTVRGLTTRRMPTGDDELELELDLVAHRLRALTTSAEGGFPLEDGLSVAAFHRQLDGVLGDLGVDVAIRAEPFGVPVTTPFAEDVEHASYDAAAATRFLRILQWSADRFEEFAGWYCGKTSPVQLFWHSFDLAVSRFSGRRAPAVPGADPVTAEAYSHEVISFGFWAGDVRTPFPAYYSYTAPEPPDLRDRSLRPASARWVEQGSGSLAVLEYEDVRTAADPGATVLEFLQSGFEAGATLAGWDLLDTATPWCPVPKDRLRALSVPAPPNQETVRE
jgi:hypothetical protein